MRIAIACYPTYGGSGVVATELGMALAGRGHEIHFLSYEPPMRLGAAEQWHANVYFHEVQVSAYPLFRYPPYDLALASRLVDVIAHHEIEVIHAHYAVPHAISAVLAREMAGGGVRVLTTLHGTDVTLVGQDKSYLPATRYGLLKSDAVTAVSRHLAEETRRILCNDCRIQVIHNFIDTDRYRPGPCAETRSRIAEPDEAVVVHLSNFRPVKRPIAVVRVFAGIARRVPARLLLVGDGPELPRAEAEAEALGVRERVSVLGQRGEIERLLPCADLLLLPSETESFGLAALEAMACGVPPLASRIGGLPEVIEDGVSGMLCPVGAVEEMADRAVALLTDPKAHRAMSAAARERAVAAFSLARGVEDYERAYRALISRD
jgi:N-acetyl-alpha-D-glucosaminyl L-malate synthase BshA